MYTTTALPFILREKRSPTLIRCQISQQNVALAQSHVSGQKGVCRFKQWSKKEISKTGVGANCISHHCLCHTPDLPMTSMRAMRALVVLKSSLSFSLCEMKWQAQAAFSDAARGFLRLD
jgi:hypothetical protein